MNLRNKTKIDFTQYKQNTLKINIEFTITLNPVVFYLRHKTKDAETSKSKSRSTNMFSFKNHRSA